MRSNFTKDGAYRMQWDQGLAAPTAGSQRTSANTSTLSRRADIWLPPILRA